MHFTKFFIFSCFALLALAGCERKDGVVPVDKTPILSVNDSIYTQADWDCDIAVRETLFTHKLGKAATDPAKSAQRREGIRLSTLTAFINETLWAQSVGKTGEIVRTSKSYDFARTNVQARYVKTFGLKDESFENLLTLFKKPCEQERMKSLIALSAEQDAYGQIYYPDTYVVASNLVMEVLGKVAKMNELVATTNIQIYAMASNLVLRARTGEDFAKLADTYSRDESKNPGGALGECDDADFPLDKETLWPVLRKMQAGEITDVMDTEDGICIYRCNKVIPDSEKTGELALDLSRIVFYRALEYPTLTFAQCKTQLENENRQDIMAKVVDAKREQLKIEILCDEKDLPKAFFKKFGKFIRKK